MISHLFLLCQLFAVKLSVDLNINMLNCCSSNMYIPKNCSFSICPPRCSAKYVWCLHNEGRWLGLSVDLVTKLGNSHRGYFDTGHKLSDHMKPVRYKPN